MIKFLNNKNIYYFSLIYLALPIILFIINWLDIKLGVIFICLIGIGIYKIKQDLNGIKETFYIIKNKQDLYKFLLLSVFILTILAVYGIGGFTNQSTDYIKHNAIFKALTLEKWPVLIDKDSALVYYFGYYIVPALFGKIFGGSFFVTQIFSLFWAFLGLFLVFLNLWVYKKDFKFYFLLIFLFFDGFDFIYNSIKNASILPFFAYEWYPYKLTHTSFGASLVWVPQHAIIAWLAAMLIINDKMLKFNGIICSLLIMWSPFVAISTLPFIIYNYINALSEKRIKEVFNFYNFLIAIPLGIIFILFFLSNVQGNTAVSGFIVNFMPIKEVVYNIFICLFFTIGIWLFVISKKSYNNPYFLISLISLVVLPFFWLGECNDLAIRGAHISFFLIMLEVINTFENATDKKKIIIAVMITLTSFNTILPLNFTLRHIKRGTYAKDNIQDLQPHLRRQYINERNYETFFYKISKKSF